MSTTTALGKVCVTPKGEFSPASGYERLDIVTYNGSSYLAKQNVPANTAISNTNYWQLIASEGAAAPSANVSAAVTSWLAENMTNPSNPAIDTSLSISGAAADAAEAGDVKRASKYRLQNLVEYLNLTSEPNSVYLGNCQWKIKAGTYSSTDQKAIFIYTNTTPPSELIAGRTYKIKIRGINSSSLPNARVILYTYVGNETTQQVYYSQDGDYILTWPSTTGGYIFWYAIIGAHTISQDYIFSMEIYEVDKDPDMYSRSFGWTSDNITESIRNFSSCDEVKTNGIYWVSSTGGVPAIPDFPLGAGLLYTSIAPNLNFAFQIAIPYGLVNQHMNYLDWQINNSIQIRFKKSGTWGNWTTIDAARGQDSLNVLDPPIFGSSSDRLSCDDINRTCILLSSSIGGESVSFYDAPFPAGWLWTICVPRELGSTPNIRFQMFFEYGSTTGRFLYRHRLVNNTWTSWVENSSSGGSGGNIYNNTYNITASPTITTDSNGWLQAVDTNTSSESGKTDMTASIMTMLYNTGYCHLGPGIFYVSGNIDMPSGSTLEGCGKDTIIRLLQTTTDGYIVRLKEYSTVKDICFSGAYSGNVPSNATTNNRKGIIFIGNRDGNTPSVSPSTTKFSTITNCWFEYLDSGFYGYNSGGGLQEGVATDNCYFYRCKVGINIAYWSEYHKFSNCVTFQCYYACVNNGGNNVFTACTFHGVIGLMMRNSTNTAHGSCVGCTFNHIDNMNYPETLGGGLAVDVDGVLTGFVFTGCQIWYGKIKVNNSVGIAFSDCLLGGSPNIEITGNYPAYFSNCIFHQTPTLSLNTTTKMLNCYLDSSGAQITN